MRSTLRNVVLQFATRMPVIPARARAVISGITQRSDSANLGASCTYRAEKKFLYVVW